MASGKNTTNTIFRKLSNGIKTIDVHSINKGQPTLMVINNEINIDPITICDVFTISQQQNRIE